LALKKSEKILLIVMGAVVIIFILTRFTGKSDKKSPRKQPSTVNRVTSNIENIASKVVGTQQQKSISPLKKQYDSWDRDPFQPIVTVRKQRQIESLKLEDISKKYSLKGFFHSEGEKSYVMINDEILAEGEEKDGLRIEDIQENRVLCTYRGRSFTLEWKE